MIHYGNACCSLSGGSRGWGLLFVLKCSYTVLIVVVNLYRTQYDYHAQVFCKNHVNTAKWASYRGYIKGLKWAATGMSPVALIFHEQ